MEGPKIRSDTALRRELTGVCLRVRAGDRTFYGQVYLAPGGWTYARFGDPFYRRMVSWTDGRFPSFQDAFDRLIRGIGNSWRLDVDGPWLLEGCEPHSAEALWGAG